MFVARIRRSISCSTPQAGATEACVLRMSQTSPGHQTVMTRPRYTSTLSSGSTRGASSNGKPMRRFDVGPSFDTVKSRKWSRPVLSTVGICALLNVLPDCWNLCVFYGRFFPSSSLFHDIMLPLHFGITVSFLVFLSISGAVPLDAEVPGVRRAPQNPDAWRLMKVRLVPLPGFEDPKWLTFVFTLLDTNLSQRWILWPLQVLRHQCR